MTTDYDIHTERVDRRSMFGDFRDLIHAASDYLTDLQRTGENVAFFQSLVRVLPDPNKPPVWENATLLDTVRNHLCEQSDDGTYRYATIPVVAVALLVSMRRPAKSSLALRGFMQRVIARRFVTTCSIGTILIPTAKG